MKKKHSNESAVIFLHDYLVQKGGCANCMWTRQVLREEGFTNGQIHYAVKKLKLIAERNKDNSAFSRTFDAWILPKQENHHEQA